MTRMTSRHDSLVHGPAGLAVAWVLWCIKCRTAEVLNNLGSRHSQSTINVYHGSSQ